MSATAYPWRWLTDAVGTSFSVRFPWVEALRRAAARAEAVCLLLPEAAGALADWAGWIAEVIDRDGAPPCLTVGGDFAGVSEALAGAYPVGIDGGANGRPADWARGFLAECRRHMPRIDPLPVLAVAADDGCAADVLELVTAQRALGYPLARPVLLRRTPPPHWSGDVVRFGLPEVVGDLHRIAPPPQRDVPFWTTLVLALTVAWEAGATPALADELWEQLRLGRTLSLRDGGFDAWLQRRLDLFAARDVAPDGPPLPAELAFGPLRQVDDALWQEGDVASTGEHFDLTPLRARRWLATLSDADAREALRRRRLANVPLARWLSAWAASIEESLRVAVLQPGSAAFLRFLQGQPPRDRRNRVFRSRLEELSPDAGSAAVVDAADFSDLAEFVARGRPGRNKHLNLAGLLDRCRQARNRVVHERRLRADDLLPIAGVVEWLAEDGLI